MNGSNRRYKLISYRKQKKWSQKEVVTKLLHKYNISITESYYGMIEQGVRTPSLNIALGIAALFDVEPIEIFLNTNTTFCCVGAKGIV